MLGHKSTVSSLVRFVTVVLFLFGAGLAQSQTPVADADKTKVEASLAAPVPVARATSAQAVRISSETNTTTPAPDPVRSEAFLMNAAVDEAPKGLPTLPAQGPEASLVPGAQCKRTIKADVLALAQPIMLNRLGAAIPSGKIFVLKRDTKQLANGQFQLRSGKRPRPLVLRANVGDCMAITLTNVIPANEFIAPQLKTDVPPPPNFPYTLPAGNTPEVSLHIEGMEWVQGSQDDGSFVGKNNSSLAAPGPANSKTYTLFARQEGTFLLYTMGDTTSTANQLTEGLFGAVNIQPANAEWYRSQVTQPDLKLATTGNTPDGHPIINYNAVYPMGSTYPDGTPIPADTPILNMLDKNLNIVHTDLTAMITGPKHGRFTQPEVNCDAAAGITPPGVDPLFCKNPAAPDRRQPYREFTIIYHGGLTPVASQAFPVFTDPTMQNMLVAGQDAFAINYGTGGIGAEVYANRIGVGPMGDCVDCKFEEFFLSAWSVGDPAMLVDKPANSNQLNVTTNPVAPCNTNTAFNTPPCGGKRVPAATPYEMIPTDKATIAFFPDDPSNVYHSYINDHLKFRILHGGRDVTHVHHQHAHQWLQSPNSDQASYLDSQMISPGASYTLEMVYNGSGNRNKVVGDSIFHCHFYPHFAAGMWAMWRTHDVFEGGTELGKNGIPIKGARALPDGEIKAGTPIPAIVPLPTIAMAPLPSPIFIDNGQIVFGTPAAPDPTGNSVKENPGFPFFIPGVAGARAPHPPLDFAPDGMGGFMDGGLPRHVVRGGTISYESHDTLDWSKDLATMNANKLPEEGTHVEQVAMKFFGQRCYPSFFPDGTPGSCPSSNSTPPQTTLNAPPTGFVLNGLPRKNPAGNSAEQLGATPGAPFADPAIDDNGVAVGNLRTYKAAAIQLDVTFNKKGWHYPQQRILTLWEDAANTLNYVSPYSFGFDPNAPAKPGARQPEPLFFRGNSGDIIEYWHTNLVPNYYLVDDFQVRTPTDILGQHIHLVKFDVTSSDGAGNGFNYEDGTFAPEEVQEVIKAINDSATHGFIDAPNQLLTPKLPPKEIVDCAANPGNPRCQPCPHNWTPTFRPQCASWLGAQTTIQRWYIDPLVDDSGEDRTLRTVFTHDHFGPSTHQQAGLYAGLLVEPQKSTWTSNDGQPMGTRSDGGPTSWQARIITGDPKDSYREFMLEFQDLQLAYWLKYPPITTAPNPDPKKGWIDPRNAINPPGSSTEARPSLITTGINITPTGTQSVNYLNEPIATRLGSSVQFPPPTKLSDLSYVFDNSIQPTVNPSVGPWDKPDPLTPLMRAYQNDNVQLRVLVGAHVFSHQFNLFGPTWFSEPAWKNSGYRSAQAMGLSEHFEMLFKVPSSSAPNTPRKCPDGVSNVNCVDYLYSPSFDESGLANGLWGLFRAYDPTAKSDDPIMKTVVPLPNNPVGPGTNVTYVTCPANLPKPGVVRTFNITAVTSQKALASQSPFPRSIVFNDRGDPNKVLANWQGIMYVRTEDLDGSGELKKGVPVEPLILRANAGDCIEVNLTNAIAPGSDVLKANFQLAPPLTNPPYPTKVSGFVGLRPQLLSYDAAKSTGVNIGWNSQGQPDQVVPFGQTVKYQWYAGKIDRATNGSLTYTPVEFGALNLFPSDTMFQNINGLFGSMIIEPQGSTWQCGELGNLANCDPSAAPPATTRASATVSSPDKTQFREFALMISDSIQVKPGISGSAVNYRTEPWAFRYTNNGTLDFSCMLSNQLVNIPPVPSTPVGDPKTPIFGANAWNQVRFRMTHPFGTGTSQVFSINGHVWQRNPYNNSSTKIGSNSLSQWIGSRDNHGSSDHFELVIDKAGGEGGLGGDYLYSVFQFLQVNQGAWGIFRVNGKGQLSPAQGTPAACKAIPKPGYKPMPAKAGKDGLMIRRPLN